ncbi:RHS repeat-associated core domain-containing protein [Muribaculaceae bacterium Z1]|nr:RHS repeat-associated core domain-containing protein [Muribaculaceae bacterium S4]NBI21476.1 RHS repeat-associated core domain-containing protein [Muribaculaceae bacterium Z1]
MVKARGIDNKIDSLVAIPVTKTRRTLIVPNQAIATYVTQWTYDSHNRLIEMIYPDEEKVTYSYNLGGLLEKVRGEKSYGYDYITKLGYDKFEQRSYLKYCNGAETFYTYDNRRRLSNLAVNSGGTSIMDNAYTFDAVSNVLSVANNASLPANGNAGGQMSHTYTYDGLYRLATATGTYTGVDSKSASYTLDMGYDNMHRITSKRQHLTQDNVQFNGTLNVGYDLSYTYSSEEGKKFQLESVKDVNYRTEETPEGNNVENGHVYSYDKNGNLVYVNTSRMMKDGHRDNSVGERKLIWDEENRLLSVDDNGFVSNYWYDADGERTVKTSGESDQVYVNGVFSGGSTNTAKFSLYVSPYLVANQGGRYTKHIYAGSQRIVSKVGDFASYGSDPRRIEYAGSETDGLSVDYKSKYTAQQQIIKDHYTFFDVPYNGTDNNNYADGEGFCCNDGTLEAAQAKAMRKVQSRAVAKSFKDPDNYENLQFFYHPDHLGSSSFITNLDGEVVQHIEYVPFGEVFIEERNSVWNTPYLFNAKEFDEETGLYYYGARYYEPRLSLWLSTDPAQEKTLHLTTYNFSQNNPINYIDADGLWSLKIKFGFSLDTGFLGLKLMGIGGSIAPFGGAKQELSIYFTIDTDNHDYGFGVSHTTTNYEYSYDLNGGFVGVSSSREKKTILDWNTYDGESFVNDYMFSSPEEQGYLNFGDFKVDPSLNGLDVNYEQSVEAIMVGAGFNLGGSFKLHEPIKNNNEKPVSTQNTETTKQNQSSTNSNN